MDITSANSKVKLFSALTPAGLSFEGYSSDAGWASEAVQIAEARMGIDGKVSFGYTPNPVPMTFTFQPDSQTIDQLNNIVTSSVVNKKPYFVQLIIEMPAIGKSFNCANGAITTAKILPDGSKVLEPQTYTITFQSVTPSPL